MKRKWLLPMCLAALVLASTGAGADEVELDPLLELLVEQGVITQEQAEAVQAEYDRRERGEAAPVAEPREAPTPPPATEEKPASGEKKDRWYDRIELKGDLRMRYEGFIQEGISDNDRRDRFRLRLRPGLYTNVTDRIRVGFQLRSGDRRDPVSDNQSFDGGFALKEFAISEAFAGFEATSWLDLIFGKFDAKKLWHVSDMQWDDDVTVEGALQGLKFGPLEASVYQYVLEEAGGGSDAYLLGGQVRGEFELGSNDALTVGVGYDDWIRPQLVVDLTLSGELRGNRVTNLLDDNDRLISDFGIVNAFAAWTHSASSRWPIKVLLFGYHNTDAKGIGTDYDSGYFGRVQFGDYKEKGQVMLRYSRYYSEPDALFYVFAQSDTTRASDVDGHRFDVRIGYVKKSYFNLTWYHTDAVYAEVPTMDRWQVDYIIRF